MTAIVERLGLNPSEFAFHFKTHNGVEADLLATFLKRAATVARGQGADLRVTGLREGSLAVIIEAVRKSTVVKGVTKEFTERPIDTTVKASGFVAGIVAAIISAMLPSQSGKSPLATAGAELVERHEVAQITIVTNETSIVVMDKEVAKHMREARRTTPIIHPSRGTVVEQVPRQVLKLLEDTRRGNLPGKIFLVEKELYFCPDGYKYLVPVDTTKSRDIEQLLSSKRYIVMGSITTLNGQPDHIIIESAVPL